MSSDRSQLQKIFLQELKDQLLRHASIKKNLDSKANSLIATTGTISIIFAAFGTFIIAEIASDYNIWQVLLGVVLIAEIGIAVWAIKSASDAYKARQYRQPIMYESLWDHENNQMNKEIINQYTASEQKDVYENLILEYTLCIKSHQEQNEMQVKDIERAQTIFYAALFSIPVFVVFTVVSGFVFV